MGENGHQNGKRHHQRFPGMPAPRLQKPLPAAVARQVGRSVPAPSGPPSLPERLRQAQDAQSLHQHDGDPRDSMSMEELYTQALAEVMGSLLRDPSSREKPMPPEYLKLFGEF